ncbi:MAG: hypothetical protein L0287_20430 [Anaerolineae bacterium]|nr:hypothetical protein [Anaerolineae bacterium]MCI0611034.1 hypothetical protein [Anaerolineae bacterium]
MRTKVSGFAIPLWVQWSVVAMIAGMLTRATHPRTLILTGFIFGLGQWVVLYPVLRSRRWLAHALWLPATAISGLVGYLLIASLGVRILGPVLIAYTAPYEDLASHLIFLTTLWMVIGLGQWPLLRDVLPHAGRWILISAGGGATGTLIDLALQFAGVEIYTSLIAGMFAGGGYGVVTSRTIEHLKGIVNPAG